MKNYKFACCFVSVWHLVSRPEQRTQTEGVWERCCGEYFELKGIKWQEVGQCCIRRGSIISNSAYCSSNITRMTKSKRMRCVRLVACMDMRNYYTAQKPRRFSAAQEWFCSMEFQNEIRVASSITFKIEIWELTVKNWPSDSNKLHKNALNGWIHIDVWPFDCLSWKSLVPFLHKEKYLHNLLRMAFYSALAVTLCLIQRERSVSC
jgi:hypothetical protein